MRTVILLLVFTACSFCQNSPAVRDIDRIRIAEAIRIFDQFGTRLWTDWKSAPFAILLITQENEFLLQHPTPSDEFKLIGYDSLLQTKVYYRARQFPPNLLATFPAVNGVPTIVIGQAENTEADKSSRWVLTLLHEHFHQLQQSHSDYYTKVNELNLAKGDESGMWMLNYAFPYDSVDLNRQFTFVSRKLREAVTASNPQFSLRFFGQYRELRGELAGLLAQDDYAYMSLQLWQEGIARYTELAMARIIGQNYTPTPAFSALDDYVPFGDVSRQMSGSTIAPLGGVSLLKELRRVAFYNFGAAEGLLLDRVSPGWRERYFREPFFLERYYPVKEK